MKITHLAAKQAILDGKGMDAAWAIAQDDEGLLPSVTKEIWVEWISRLIEREAA